jgi:hypothetical protein
VSHDELELEAIRVENAGAAIDVRPQAMQMIQAIIMPLSWDGRSLTGIVAHTQRLGNSAMALTPLSVIASQAGAKLCGVEPSRLSQTQSFALMRPTVPNEMAVSHAVPALEPEQQSKEDRREQAKDCDSVFRYHLVLMPFLRIRFA